MNVILLLSGEGSSDIGKCSIPINFCDTSLFVPGPMAFFVDQLFESKLNYSLLDMGGIRFISEHGLSLIAKKTLVNRKRPRLPRKNKQKETLYFEKNARALAIKAKALSTECKDEVVSVLFRDADGTASTIRGLYEAKRESMFRGFEMEAYSLGIPMIPKPKSEAWLLCALKSDPYHHCAVLENESGNDNSPKALKKQLEQALGHHADSNELADLVKNRSINIAKIDMPSLNDFKTSLFDVLQS